MQFANEVSFEIIFEDFKKSGFPKSIPKFFDRFFLKVSIK